MKNDMRGEVTYLLLLLLCSVLARKNVGMTMTCNRYDVMNVILVSDFCPNSV